MGLRLFKVRSARGESCTFLLIPGKVEMLTRSRMTAHTALPAKSAMSGSIALA